MNHAASALRSNDLKSMLARRLGSTTATAEDAPALRVLMRPAATRYGQSGGNAYVPLLRKAVEAHGIEVVPYSSKRAIAGKYDVVHIHWPDRFAWRLSVRNQLTAITNGIIFFGAIFGRRKPLVWTVHNLKPHPRYHRSVLRIIQLLLSRSVRLMILLARASRLEMEAEEHPCRHLPAVVVPHGVYPPVTCPGDGDEFRRQLRLGPEHVLCAFVGAMHPYKGVDALISAFTASDDDGLRLIVAGAAPNQKYLEHLQRAIDDDPRASLEIGPLAVQRLETIMRAADVVALPYRRVLNSGSALHALSVGTQVLVPNTPTFCELASAVGNEWVHRFETLRPDEIERVGRNHPSGAPDLSEFQWSRIGRDTADAYRIALIGA